MEVSSVNDWSFINSVTFLGIRFCTRWRIAKFDFSIFTESLFTNSQTCTFPSSLSISLSSMLRSLYLKNEFASSAIGENPIILGNYESHLYK